MKKIKFFFTFLCISLAGQGFAQGIMSFDKTTHDFGTIDEGVVASYEFEFTNTGDQPIEIAKVKASCGCTTPYWTKEVIYPGKKGRIKASYNSKGRPGPFSKSVTINSNAKKATQIIFIKGFVNPSKEVAKSQSYNVAPNQLTATAQSTAAPPNIRLDKTSHDFGRIETGKVVKQRFRVHNAGQQNLVITQMQSICKCVRFGLSNDVIAPGQTAYLELSFDAEKIAKLEDTFKIFSNDPQSPTKEISLKAEVYENFSNHLFIKKE